MYWSPIYFVDYEGDGGYPAQGVLYVPWYIGDSASDASRSMCTVVVQPLSLQMTIEQCSDMLEQALIQRVQEVSDMVPQYARLAGFESALSKAVCATERVCLCLLMCVCVCVCALPNFAGGGLG